MSAKHKKCCCCPPCKGAVGCCRCTCTRLCATFTPSSANCNAIGTELIWDGESYSGSVGDIDLYYYFEQIYEECWFKLRSNYLGYPQGSERAWRVGYDVNCDNLSTAVSVAGSYEDECIEGQLTTSCSPQSSPRDCIGCECVCECICITYHNDACAVQAKACWDSSIQGWSASVCCGDNETVSITLKIARKGDYCNFLDPLDYNCNIADDACVLVLFLDGEAKSATILGSCPDINATFTVDTAYGITVVTALCAACSEDCCDCIDFCTDYVATITATNCPCWTTPIVVPLPYNGSIQGWAGSASYGGTSTDLFCVTSHCDPVYLVDVLLECINGQMSVTVTFHSHLWDDPYTTRTDALLSSAPTHKTCDPPQVTFTITPQVGSFPGCGATIDPGPPEICISNPTIMVDITL